jgi:glutamyl-tRNA synthetase
MAQREKSVRVRYAPSPTGHWHLGGVRTALFNWLFARKHGGAFVVRIEDTDSSRSRREYEEEIFDALRWLGLQWDEGPQTYNASGRGTEILKGEYGPYRQSERLHIYRVYLEKLLEEGKAYYCYCSKDELDAERQTLLAEGLPARYGGRCRNLREAPSGREPQAIRFKIPEAKVEFKDIVRGSVTFDAALFGDVIIAKNLDAPIYNFAVVVDDHEMAISHIIRGEEHISNTPKQILFQRALGFETPIYAHLPLILNADRSKLSKRNSETSLLSYREDGYLPEALVNFLALLGWHPKGSEEEIMDRKTLIKKFDLRHTQKAGAVFDIDKLQWINRAYIKRLSDAELAAELRLRLTPERASSQLAEPNTFEKLAAAVRDRITVFSDFPSLAEFFFVLPPYEPELLVWKDGTPEKTRDALERLRIILDAVPPNEFHREHLEPILAPLIDELGRGDVLWPFRVALSGLRASPDPFVIASVLGKSEVLSRLEDALHRFDAYHPHE